MGNQDSKAEQLIDALVERVKRSANLEALEEQYKPEELLQDAKEPIRSYIEALDDKVQRLTTRLQQLERQQRAKIAAVIQGVTIKIAVSQEENQCFLRPLCLGELIRDVVETVKENYREHNVNISLKAPANPIVVVVPEDGLTNLLFDMMEYAITAAIQGVTIKIAVSVADDVLTLGVSDQDSGMPTAFESHTCQLRRQESDIFELSLTTKGGKIPPLSLSKREEGIIL